LEVLKDLAFRQRAKQFLDEMQQQRENESHLASSARLWMQIFAQDFEVHPLRTLALCPSWPKSVTPKGMLERYLATNTGFTKIRNAQSSGFCIIFGS
jgi:hypothetical protein